MQATLSSYKSAFSCFYLHFFFVEVESLGVVRTLRLFAFLLTLTDTAIRVCIGSSYLVERPIIGIKMLKTLLKMLKNQHNF